MATVYSDSIIVDAIPQSSDENGNYINRNGNAIKVEAQEKHLTRQQVVHMLKDRFKGDFDEWQHGKDENVSNARPR